MGLLLGCALLITAVQLVTDPIICDVKVFTFYIFTIKIAFRIAILSSYFKKPRFLFPLALNHP